MPGQAHSHCRGHKYGICTAIELRTVGVQLLVGCGRAMKKRCNGITTVNSSSNNSSNSSSNLPSTHTPHKQSSSCTHCCSQCRWHWQIRSWGMARIGHPRRSVARSSWRRGHCRSCSHHPQHHLQGCTQELSRGEQGAERLLLPDDDAHACTRWRVQGPVVVPHAWLLRNLCVRANVRSCGSTGSMRAVSSSAPAGIEQFFSPKD